MTYAYIGLGSNSGHSYRHLQQAVQRLRRLRGARLSALSPTYRSAPVGCPGQQPPYYNAVAEVQTALPPRRLFKQLRQVEQSVQKKPRPKNSRRRLDVDYLAHGTARHCSRKLTLPHPRLYRRAFVLQPLDDILRANPRRRHPFNAAYLRQRLAACRDQPLHRLCRSC